MKTITIAMQKGGVGKSTLTRSLAVAASKVGHNVLVLDMDAQQSISQWAERRDEQLPVVKFSSEIELPKMLETAKRAGCDLVIIDTPPARSTAAPAAVVLTMVHPNSQREEKIAREVFAAIGIPMAEAIFHRFKVHRDASREGATAQEIEPDSKAAKEIQILWNWVCAELQIGTNANVHKIARR